MIGGIEETSASFEARSAPQSYPTRGDCGCVETNEGSEVSTIGLDIAKSFLGRPRPRRISCGTVRMATGYASSPDISTAYRLQNGCVDHGTGV